MKTYMILILVLFWLPIQARAASDDDFRRLAAVEQKILEINADVLKKNLQAKNENVSINSSIDFSEPERIRNALLENGLTLPQYLRLRTRNLESYNAWLSEHSDGFAILNLREKLEALRKQADESTGY